MIPDPKVNYADLSYGRSNFHFAKDDVGAVYFFHRFPSRRTALAVEKAQAAVECYLSSGAGGINSLCNGASIFIYDHRRRQVLIFADNEGLYPLYYRRAAGQVFVSFSPLGANEGRRLSLESKAVSAYLDLDYIPSPLTVFRGVFKTSPGVFIRVKDGVLKPERHEGFLKSAAPRSKAVRRGLRDALEGAIRVPGLESMGLLLSGGVDSTLLCHLAAGNYKRIFTFTMSCLPFNERTVVKSRQVAVHYGCVHKEVPFGIKDYVSSFPRQAEYLAEPLFNQNVPILQRIFSSVPAPSPCLLYGWGGDEMFGDRLGSDFGANLGGTVRSKTSEFFYCTVKAPRFIEACNCLSRPFSKTVLFPYLSPDVLAFGISLSPKLRRNKVLLKSIEPSVMDLRPVTNRENSYDFLTIAKNITYEHYRGEIADSPLLKQALGRIKVRRLLGEKSFNPLKLIILHYWLSARGGHIS